MEPDSIRVAPITRRLAAGVVLVSLLLAAWAVWATSGYWTDDVFIHLQYARSLSEGKGFVFNAGEPPSYGCTSPLWVAVLAAFQPLHLAHPEAPAKLLGWALMFANLLLVAALSLRLLRRLGRPDAWVFVPVLLWGANPALVRWQGSGMETPLFVAMLLVVLLVQRPFAKQSLVRSAVAGLLIGALYLVRPEAVHLAAAFGAAGLVAFVAGPDRRRVLLSLVATGLGCLAVVAPWLAYAQSAFGTIVPNTVLAKGASRGIAFHAQYLRDLGAVVLQTFAAESVLILAGLAAWALVKDRLAVRLGGMRDEILTWLLFPAIFEAVHAMMGAYAISRYYVVLMPCVMLVVVIALDRLASVPGLCRRASLAAGLIVLVVAAADAGLTVKVFVPHMRMHAEGNARVKELALKLRDLARPGDAVVANDIGVLAYWSGVKVIDLVGLVTREMIEQNRRGAEADYLAGRHPRFYMLHGPQGVGYLARVGSRAKEIARAHYPSFTLLDRRGDDYVLGEVDWE